MLRKNSRLSEASEKIKTNTHFIYNPSILIIHHVHTELKTTGDCITQKLN